MAQRIVKGDLVKIISGDNQGKTARVLKVMRDKNQALLEGIGERVRHIAKSYANPNGGKRDIQVAVNLSKLTLVIDEKTGQTSRVGYKLVDGKKVRVAKQAKDSVIKPTATKDNKKKGAK